jgi:hypothetical protein
MVKKALTLCISLILLYLTGCTNSPVEGRTPSLTGLPASPAATTRELAGLHTTTPGAVIQAMATATALTYPYPYPSRQPYVSITPRPYPDLPATVQPPSGNPTSPAVKAWPFPNNCSAGTVVVPYHNASGVLSLQVQESIGGLTLWDWDQESRAAEIQWQLLEPFTREYVWNTFAFLGSDQASRRWIGVLFWDCQQVHFQVLLPVSQPAEAYLVTRQAGRDSPWEYWLVDDGRLTLFASDKTKALVRLSTQDVPGGKIFLESDEYTDLTGDGRPELLIHWSKWQTESSQRGPDVLIQIYATEGESYRLIGEIQPGWQAIDLHSDGAIEFLKPVPPGFPQEWQVYGLQGGRYTWLDTILYPQEAGADWVDPQNLPALPFDLYFQRGGAAYRWPKKGGALQQVASLPMPKPGLFCKGNQPKERVLSWSPDCRYAVVAILGKIEGASYAVFDGMTGKRIDIPDSFVYASGHSTFAWDPKSRYLIHARAEGGQGLYRIDLPGGKLTTLLALSGLFVNPPFGAAAPSVLADGSIIFSIQGGGPLEAPASRYPPNGIYRWTPAGELRRIASLPPAATAEPRWSYGTLIPAPDQSVFLYLEPDEYESPPYRTMLLVQANGKKAWNVLPMIGDATGFVWVK